jgi:hypothetical protein
VAYAGAVGENLQSSVGGGVELRMAAGKESIEMQ